MPDIDPHKCDCGSEWRIYATKRHGNYATRYVACGSCQARDKVVIPATELRGYRASLLLGDSVESIGVPSYGGTLDNEPVNAQFSGTTMPYLTLNDCSSRFGVSVATLTRLVQRGEFVRPVKLGRQYRFAADDVASWERRQRGVEGANPLAVTILPSEEVKS